MTEDNKKLIMYVYYKIPSHELSCGLLAVKNLNHAVKKLYPNLVINHQKRLDVDAENRELWMETYDGIPGLELENFTADLTLLAEQHHLPKERKYEVFISL